MATLYGVGANKRLNSDPVQNVKTNQQHGRVRVSYDEYEFGTSAALALNDVVELGVIPSGARVVGGHAAWDDLDSGGTPTARIEIGYADNGVDSADSDGFFAALDVTAAGQADMGESTAAPAALFKEMGAETKIQAKISTAGAAAPAAAGKLKVAIFYVLD